MSYWGGSLAALGGALLLVAYRKITYFERYRYGWLAGAAIAVLMWSRPFEGGLLTFVLAVGIFRWFRGQPRAIHTTIVKHAFATTAIVLAVGAAAQAIYDKQVTGDYFELPYMLAERQYHVAPVLWPLNMGTAKTYRDEVLRVQHAEWEPMTYRQLHEMNLPARVVFLVHRVRDALNTAAPLMLFLPLAFLFYARRSVRFLLLAGLAGISGLCLETWLLPHYLAPWFPLALLLAFIVARNLRVVSWRGTPAGFALLVMVVVASFGSAVLNGMSNIQDYIHQSTTRMNVGRERAKVASYVAGMSGRHVVIVRYSRGHNIMQEWVYNAANIDTSPVIWARDRGDVENRQLLKYFKDRTIWLLEPDTAPPNIRRYQQATEQQ
jgi:hypothetical protein